MNVREWISEAAARLEAAEIESPKLEAEVLAAHVLGVERVWLIAHPEPEFPDLAGEGLLQRRLAREPLAYIIGWREFYGRRFKVRPGVLIPRQETEILLDSALPRLHDGPFLDIGTGSGCLAISAKLENPYVDVVAVDISENALEIARENAEDLGASVQFVLSDLFEGVKGQKFEIIVSNPPYIADYEELMPEVGLHEPKQALFSGPTGFEVYERIAAEAKDYLTERGRLLLEVGHTQGNGVKAIFEGAGWFYEWTVEDLQGYDRVLAFSWPS